MSNANYKGSRMTLPRLCNTYSALQESFQYSFDAASGECLRIPHAVNMNLIKGFEPVFLPKDVLSTSPLASSMFLRYEEFRIRKVCVSFTSSELNPINSGRSDAWIYWCPNHTNFDAEGGVASCYQSIADISEAARFQHVKVLPGKSFKVEYVPQVVFQNAVTISGSAVDQSGDGKMPWMKCNTANKDSLVLRAPVVYFRRPFITASNVGVVEHDYQVMVTCIIEFRNLNDDN